MTTNQQIVLIICGIMAIPVFIYLMNFLLRRDARRERVRKTRRDHAIELLRYSIPNSVGEAQLIEYLESTSGVAWWDLNVQYGTDRPRIRDAYLRKLREAL